MLIYTIKGVCLFDANANDGNNHLKYIITSSLHGNYHLFLKNNRQKVVKTMLFKISIHKVVNFHPKKYPKFTVYGSGIKFTQF